VDITITVISRELDTRQAQMMKQMQDAVGLRTEIEAMERIAWGKKVREGGLYQMATQATGTTVDPDPLLTLAWASEGVAVYTRAVVPEMDQCLQEGRSTYDVKQRHEIYKRCQKIMFDTAWWGFAWMQNHNYVLNKAVKNLQKVWGDIRQEEMIWLDR
jgi:peptide/nickel transport system substrate-binding protein